MNSAILDIDILSKEIFLKIMIVFMIVRLILSAKESLLLV